MDQQLQREMTQLQELVELPFLDLQGSNLPLAAQSQLSVPIEQLQQLQEPSLAQEAHFISILIESQLPMERIQAKKWQSSPEQDQHGQEQVIHSHQFQQQSAAFHQRVMPFDQKTLPFNEFQGLQFQRQMVRNNVFDQQVVPSRSFQSLSQLEQDSRQIHLADDSAVAQYVQDKWLVDKRQICVDGYNSQEVSLMPGGQVADDKSCLLDSHDLQFERTVERSAINNDTHQFEVFGSVMVSRGDRGQLARYPSSMLNVSGLAEIDDNQSQFHTSMVNIEEMFDGLNKDVETCMRKFDCMVQHVSQVPIPIKALCLGDSVDVNGFQECVDLQSEYGESTSSEKFSSIEGGLKDVDTSLNDHSYIRHSGPSHQVSSFSPLEHKEQCCLNSARVDFAAMKLSSIEGSSNNVFQKNESSDDSSVQQSGFIADIVSDSSYLNHQERGRLIMLDSDETKDTSPTVDEMSKGSICNGWQHRAATAKASVSSQFSHQDKSRLTAPVSTKLICNDSDPTRQLDSSTDFVSLRLEQLGQSHLETLGEEHANMGKIELPEVESFLKKVVGGNKSRVQHIDSGGDRVKQTVASSQAKGCSNHTCIYDKRGSMGSNYKRRIMAKKDDDVKPKVDENREDNEDNRCRMMKQR
ncbi:OLC1v1015877C1 [Oldenlandia corymbosa var. corymbosa]|uniref:OLC1v1015877C1 n=1 Tax=Oldenlandia corymbosa var. corymbosa TaxID=529605 RepID=A0AAV1E456_OLDCO|nr:OLC1v1015877C1 [Oldenlandia corymbosa var. corymbosa]